MTGFHPTRRTVVLGSIGTTSLLLGMTEAARSATAARPDINSAAGAKMVDLYAAAVKAMQDPAINFPPRPQSWTFQAYMHFVPLNPFDPANSGGVAGAALQKRVDDMYGNPASNTPQAAWKQAALACWSTCQHSSPHFTTWHRWYLYYFERICRKMSGHPEFMLPYWNYASDNGASLQLPVKFRQASTNSANPNTLFFDDRGLGFANANASGPQNVPMNSGGFLPSHFAQYQAALSTPNMFPSALPTQHPFDPNDPIYRGLGIIGRLECVPHNDVHSLVGGWMQNVPSAAGDPIFYMHHCQIDRLFASWETFPGSAYNWGNSASQPDETTWKNKTSVFVDENGSLVSRKLSDAMDTSTLAYTYDSLVKQPPPPVALTSFVQPAAVPPGTAPLTLAAMEGPGFNVQSGGTTVTLSPKSTTPPPGPAPSPAPSATPGATPGHFTLVLSGVKLIRHPPAPLSIFVNLPTDASPRLNNPYYVGTLSLFNFDPGTGGVMDHSDMNADHAMAGATLRFDVTDVLERQRARGLWDGGTVTVTISTIGADTSSDTTYVTIEGIAIEP